MKIVSSTLMLQAKYQWAKKLSLFILAFSWACGQAPRPLEDNTDISHQQPNVDFDPDGPKDHSQELLTGKNVRTIGSENHDGLIPIKVSLVQASGDSLGASLSLLAEATDFSITMDSCLSGFGSTATAASGLLRAYKYDSNCRAKLTSFSLNGASYVPSAGDPFETWQAGDVATFENALDGSQTLLVSVVATLSNPLLAADTVAYEFKKIAVGNGGSILRAMVGNTATLGGNPTPAFAIKFIALEGETAGFGGVFRFTLECLQPLSGNSCGGIQLANIRYRLVADTYNDVLTLPEAQALFPVGESDITLPGEKLAPGQGGTSNGGFLSKALAGPDAIYDNPHMIFIIEAEDRSYRYFNVDMQVTVNF